VAPFTAMTTVVRAWVETPLEPRRCRRRLRRVFHRVERRLSRFRADSELNRFCAAGGGRPSPALFRALTTAARAWRRTGGLFDPRVRAVLEALGYGPDLRFDGGAPPVVAAPTPGAVPAPGGPLGWEIRWRDGSGGGRGHRLCLPAAAALDLGGIGKGLAVRYAARVLRRMAGTEPRAARTLGPCGRGDGHSGFLVDAGGDIWAEGCGPGGSPWRIGVPDPRGSGRPPLAILRLAHRAVCSSSRGRRAWLLGDRPVHHLIDPRRGQPADRGLWSVTVVGRDPAWAEVWSKSLFVAGADRGPALAEARGLAAAFCWPDGRCWFSPACQRYVESTPTG
jgi:thiamine biosynthesis lipoprotein